jgi:putative transposase
MPRHLQDELEMTEYGNVIHARTDIASYFAYYNTERRRSALDYLSPHHIETLKNHP